MVNVDVFAPLPQLPKAVENVESGSQSAADDVTSDSAVILV